MSPLYPLNLSWAADIEPAAQGHSFPPPQAAGQPERFSFTVDRRILSTPFRLPATCTWRHAAELACMFWPSERWQCRVESVTNEQVIIVHERTRPQNIVRKAVERSEVQVVQPSQSLHPPL